MEQTDTVKADPVDEAVFDEASLGPTLRVVGFPPSADFEDRAAILLDRDAIRQGKAGLLTILTAII